MPKEKPLAIDLNKEDSALQIYSRSFVLSSHDLGWNGIHVEYHRQPSIEYPSSEESFAQHVIGLRLGSPTEQEMVFDGHLQRKLIGPGDSVLVPAGVPHGSQCDNECEYILLSIEPTFFGRTAYESIDPDHVELVPHFAKPDLLMYGIGLALKTELETDGFSSCLYAESAAMMLSAHLLRHYSARKPTFREYRNGLPKYKLQQAIDYINANLNQEIKLADLADLVGMSQYYFCHLFKQSMGIAPYKYVIWQRVERAKQLLQQREVCITDIALECGFANQSHFTKHFHKLTGITPKAYRER